MSIIYEGENNTEDQTNLHNIYKCETETCMHNVTNWNDTYANVTYSYICAPEPNNEVFFMTTVFHFCVYAMYGIIFFIALLGNGLVCYVVRSSPRMKTITNFFIANLAVGDIMMTIFCIPFSFVSTLVLRYWPFGGLMCKIVNFSQAVSVLVSAYTLLAISVDRYKVIMQPLKPRLGKTVAKIVIICVWVGAMITAVPILLVSKLQRPTLFYEVCERDICTEIWTNPDDKKQYTCALLALQFALPLSALVYTYIRIAYVVWGVRPPGEAELNRDSRIQHSKRKMIKMMVMVITVFTICWLPLNVFLMLWTTHENDNEWVSWPGMPYVWFASHWLAMSHCCYNPIIYCYMNSRYRRGFQQALESLFCLRKNSCPHQRSSVAEGIPMADIGAESTSRRLQCSCRFRTGIIEKSSLASIRQKNNLEHMLSGRR